MLTVAINGLSGRVGQSWLKMIDAHSQLYQLTEFQI